jgi:hypothetical protein
LFRVEEEVVSGGENNGIEEQGAPPADSDGICVECRIEHREAAMQMLKVAADRSMSDRAEGQQTD